LQTGDKAPIPDSLTPHDQKQFEYLPGIGYINPMFQLTARLLIFFILFTHSAIAMDVHVPHEHTSSHEQVSVLAPQSLQNTKHDSQISLSIHDCNDLGGHCSHSSAHISGITYRLQLPAFKVDTSLNAWIHIAPYIHTETPPHRPPKA